MPVYQLLGGKCRKAVETYRHASGPDVRGRREGARGLMEQGQRYVRVQVAVPGLATYGAGDEGRKDEPTRRCQRPGANLGAAGLRPHRAEAVRAPAQASSATRWNCCTTSTSACRRSWRSSWRRTWSRTSSFFLEDPFSPEDIGYFEKLRPQTSTPIAMGELFNNPNEWVGLVSNRLIDFIRIHMSQIGGLTMARKMAALCEFFGVRTAWHGPGDVSPVGHAANVHLDLATPELRRAGGAGVHPGRARCLPRLPGAEGRLLLGERQARPRDRSGREARGEVPDHRRSAVRLPMGQPASEGWFGWSRAVTAGHCQDCVDDFHRAATRGIIRVPLAEFPMHRFPFAFASALFFATAASASRKRTRHTFG